MIKAILSSQKDGILVFRVEAGRASKVNVVPRHAAMHCTATFDTGNIRDTGYDRTIFAFWAARAQWDAATTTYK
jgi:hypothetical protein